MRISEQAGNRLAVLKTIRRAGPVSRSDLIQMTGLSSGTITNLTSDLLAHGLVTETRSKPTRAGRPRLNLEIAAGGIVVVGAAVRGGNRLKAWFVDLAGAPLHSAEATYEPPGSLPELARRISEALNRVLEEFPGGRDRVRRAALSMPGIIDSAKGEVHSVTSLTGTGVPVAEIVSQVVGIPVTIEHELACMARAEHWFGRTQKTDTFTMVHVGLALGLAEYADGLPRAGANGLTPDLRHVKTDFSPDARECLCGAKGCLMMYSSMFGMLQASNGLDEIAFPPLDHISGRFERLLDNARDQNAVAIQVLHEGAEHLGRAIANLINANDPGLVLVSFLNEGLLERFASRVRAALGAYTHPAVLAATRVDFIVAAQDWRASGTAALALERAYIDGV